MRISELNYNRLMFVSGLAMGLGALIALVIVEWFTH